MGHFHENSIQSAYGGWELKIRDAMAKWYGSHGAWMGTNTWNHQRRRRLLNCSRRGHLEAKLTKCMGKLSPKLEGNGASKNQILKASSLSSLGIKEHEGIHFEASEQGYKD